MSRKKEVTISEWEQQREESVRDKKLTQNHKILLKALYSKKVVLITGPAGTAKTYLSCRVAADLLRQKKIEKIVISRPLVQCDEDLGILPGNLEEKLAPYIAPIVNAMKNYLPDVEQLMKSKVIEIVPLATMRGSTFKNCFVIIDEAENATYRQLKMVLTRLGENCIISCNGDASQSDLRDYNCPFIEVINDLMYRKHPDIFHIELTRNDCLRSELVQFIDEQLSDKFVANEPPPTYGKTRFYD